MKELNIEETTMYYGQMNDILNMPVEEGVLDNKPIHSAIHALDQLYKKSNAEVQPVEKLVAVVIYLILKVGFPFFYVISSATAEVRVRVYTYIVFLTFGHHRILHLHSVIHLLSV